MSTSNLPIPDEPSLEFERAVQAVVDQGWGNAPAEPASPPVDPTVPMVEVTGLDEPPAMAVLPPPDFVDEYPKDESGEDGKAKPGYAARHVGVGLLAELAAGRKNATQVADEAGVSKAQLESDLALALKEVDPKEITKTLGIQAAEQQLVSGAVYGVVLASLVGDLAAGTLKPEHRLDLAKLLARVGRIEPKEEKGGVVGSGFQLNIIFGGSEPKPVVVEAQPAVEAQA